MKNIMKRAWEIFRTLAGDRLAKLSQALKMAWAEIKNAVVSGRDACIARLNKIMANSCTYDYCELWVSVKDWANYGKDRTYFKIVEESTDKKRSKHYKAEDYGYYDNVADVYVPGRADLNENFTFSGARF